MKYHVPKRIIILLIIIGFIETSFLPVVNSSIFCEKQNSSLPIVFEVAKQVAEKKIYLSNLSYYSILESTQIKSDNNYPIFYIFTLTPIGYIVVPTTKKLPPVIAYSFGNEFGNISEKNILLQILKADISNRISNINLISEDIIKNREKQWQKYFNLVKINQQNSLLTVGPLLDTKWSQSAPYNNFCPIDLNSGDRSVAGCPAVAMAQILNYHRTTQNVQFNDDDDYLHNYAGNRYKIDDDFSKYDFPSFPELNNYLDSLQYNYENENPLTDNDKAALNFACGVAAEQVYNPSGSGTFGVHQAYEAYKRFNFDYIKLLTEGFDVYNHLQSNILNGYPAHIAVVNEDWDIGHNMVVDGYEEEGYFHINFGWGGKYDGWYILPEELPLELTVLEGLIVDIYPLNQNGNLEGSGILNWVDISPGSTVTGSFKIRNNGTIGSSINWGIVSWPDWGVWTFTPSNGENLTPQDGEETIGVSVIVPDEKNEDFSGYVKVVNTENSSDYCLIHISLTTPKNLLVKHYLLQFFKNHFNFLSYLYSIIFRN